MGANFPSQTGLPQPLAPTSFSTKPALRSTAVIPGGSKQMGPQAMRDKLKSNMLDNSRTEAAQKKQPVTQKQTEKDDDEYSNGSFEQDENDAGTGED